MPEGLTLSVDSPLPAQPGGSAVQVDPTNRDMAVRVRAWFLEAWTHPLWVDYRREAEEDEGFYAGGEDQWVEGGSSEALRRLKDLKRATVSINHIQGLVDILTGFERQNRFDLKAAPQGEEDEDSARLFTWLLKDVQDKADVHATSSDVFEDGIIKGLGAAEVAVDWTQDPVRGEIVVERLEPGVDLIWDAHAKDWRRFRDCRYMIRYKQAFVDDLTAQYPQHKAAIEEAADRLGAVMAEGRSTDGPPNDAYGGVGDARRSPETAAPVFYDHKSRQALVLEAWYEDFESAWVVTSKQAGQVYEAASGEAARAAAAADPKDLTAIRRMKRMIKMAVVLPATMQTLETDDTPYDNDQQAYPFVVYVGKRKRNKIYGIVRNMKDPQRVLNKRESQLLDVLIQYATARRMYESGSLENPQHLKDSWSTEPIIYRPGRKPPGWDVPEGLGELFRVLGGEGDRYKMFMRESSGINTDLLGLRSDDASGIAIARRQAQGQVIATVWFDNYRNFKRELGQRLARRIQQVYTYERVFRLTNDIGEPIALTVNPLQRDEQGRSQQADPRRRVLSDVKALEFDILVSEAPSTPSMRAMSLLAVLEIIKTLPGLAGVFMDKIVELADMPDKAELLQRVRQVQQSQGIVGGGGPPQQPPPGPPGPDGIPTGTQPGMPVPSPEIRAGQPAQ